MHPAKLTFQALRIHLNQEFDEMRRGMRAAMETMRDGGALGVLTVRFRECFFSSVPSRLGFSFSSRFSFSGASDATPCREPREHTFAGEQ